MILLTYIKNQVTIVSMFTLFPLLAFGKSNAQSDSEAWIFLLNNIVLVIGIVIAIAVFFTFFRFTTTIIDSHRDESLDTSLSTSQGPSFFKRMYDKAWNIVPQEKEMEVDLGHSFDGIRELDNNLPPWWIYLFYLTIIWACAYIYIYHISDLGLNQKAEYTQEVKMGEDQKRAYLAKQKNVVDESNVEIIEEADRLEAGKQIFLTTCSACHAQDGGGGVGPNLTDKYWIHGGGIKEIFTVIKYGVPEKGMQSWQSQIQPTSMQNIASYILTLQGTTPGNPKEAQGDLYVAENEAQ